MIKGVFRLFVIFLLVIPAVSVTAQPFADEIADFKKQDAAAPPQKNSILFVGSSSFTMWQDVQDYFPKHKIINRGFGGSALPDVIRYADDIIFPYQPKQIVIYCGENDIASSDTVTAAMVLERFISLFTIIRKKMPGVPVAFTSIKPSPSRWNMMDRMIKANRLIRAYLTKQKDAKYINVWDSMLGPDGKPWDALFIEDNLHMNAKGYSIWQKIIEPYLEK